MKRLTKYDQSVIDDRLALVIKNARILLQDKKSDLSSGVLWHSLSRLFMAKYGENWDFREGFDRDLLTEHEAHIYETVFQCTMLDRRHKEPDFQADAHTTRKPLITLIKGGGVESLGILQIRKNMKQAKLRDQRLSRERAKRINSLKGA
jgi:hypothetical protein